MVALSFTLITAFFSSSFDFRAFYCAGYAARIGANPYHTQPLHACERTQTGTAAGGFFDKVVLPAPQPAYDIAAFSIISRLPFGAASKLWTALLALCSLGTVILVQRFTREPIASVFAALWLSLCLPSIYLGETVPLCLLSIAAAALFAQKSRFELAGLAAAATLVEPHIGIPVCLSTAVWLPRSRAALGASVLALIVLSAAFLGVHGNLEYVLAVLPAHALSEIGSDAQLSLTAVLHALGVSDAIAVRTGSIAFAVATIAGVVFAGKAARRFNNAAFIPALPPAFAVMGGVFMHVTEVAAAIPLALLLVAHMPRLRPLLGWALILLAVPWWSLATPMLFGTSTGVMLAAVTVCYLSYCYTERGLLAAACVAVLAGAATTLVLRWHDATAVHALVTSTPQAFLTAPYPEASWKWFNDEYMSTNSAASWLLRAGSWAGLLLLACSLYVVTRERVWLIRGEKRVEAAI